jgi:hypothetical protein
MTAFLVDVKEARPETLLPCQGEPRSFRFAFVSSAEKIKTRQGVGEPNRLPGRSLLSGRSRANEDGEGWASAPNRALSRLFHSVAPQFIFLLLNSYFFLFTWLHASD